MGVDIFVPEGGGGGGTDHGVVSWAWEGRMTRRNGGPYLHELSKCISRMPSYISRHGSTNAPGSKSCGKQTVVIAKEGTMPWCVDEQSSHGIIAWCIGI